MKSVQGFTLVQLLVGVLVISAGLAIAAHNIFCAGSDAQLDGYAHGLLDLVNSSRIRAVHEQHVVVSARRIDVSHTFAQNQAMSRGLPDVVVTSSPSFTERVAFDVNGMSIDGDARFTLCPRSPYSGQRAKVLQIDHSGAAQVVDGDVCAIHAERVKAERLKLS